jgi:hypothetical protein
MQKKTRLIKKIYGFGKVIYEKGKCGQADKRVVFLEYQIFAKSIL